MNKKKVQGAKNKPKSKKLIVITILMFSYFLYKFFMFNHIEVEIYDKEFEEMMLNGVVEEVVCIKNKEIVDIEIKKDSIDKCILILKTMRGVSLFDENKPDIMSSLKRLLNIKKHISFYMIIPSINVFDKNFKAIENKLYDSQKIGYKVITYISWKAIFKESISILFTLFFIYYILLSIGLIKGGKGGIGSLFGFGKSKGKLFDKNDKNKITFKDVAGLIEPKNECQEIIELLKNSKKLDELGGKMPKGILFVGPPGNGKTLLARAIAGECDASFFYLSASDIGGIFYGLGSSHVRALFEEARENTPAIIFIDEIDSIGKSRNNLNRGNDDQENTLNSLLVEMDGFDNKTNIIVIGSTNRVEVLDKALLRPGRFDVKILFDKPVLKERIEILNLYLNKIKYNKDEVNIERLGEQTVDFSSAEIANVCNEATLLAARKNKDMVEWVDIQEAMDRVIAGIEKKSRVLKENEKKLVSYHEAGHALVSWFLKYAHPLLKVTIISRGEALGYAQYTPEEKFITTKEELIDDLCTFLGGRCSEELIFNTMSTGAANDLENAHSLALHIIAIYGMNEKIGNLSYHNMIQNNPYYIGKPYSEETAKVIDEEIKKLIDQCYVRVKRLITEKKDLLDKLASELFTKEVLLKDDIEKIIGPREPYFE